MTHMGWGLLLLHALATSAMFGVIWMVQWVQYPLFASVGNEAFTSYHAGHVSKITFVVLPLMALELGTAALLTLQGYNPFNSTLWYLSLAVLAGIWLSTMLWQVPLHNKLASGFMMSAWQGLVQGNWLRTVGWSIRTGIVFYLIWSQLRVHQA